MPFKPTRILKLFLSVLIAALAWAQDAAALVGRWNMTSETNGDSVKWTLVLKETDGKLAALLKTDSGEMPAKDFTYIEGVLKFKAPYQGQDYDIELKADGAKLKGTWSGGEDSGETYGVKAQ